MNNMVNNYFKPIKEKDQHKLMMNLNEVRDPVFEEYVGNLIKDIEVEKLMRYPNEKALYDAYSYFYKLPPQYFGVGHGSDEVIGRIFQMYKNEVFHIGSNEYYMAAVWANIHNIKTTNNVNNADVIYIGNPNSHNGVDNTARIRFFLAMGKTVIVDEVYAWFNKARKNTFMYEAIDNDNLWVIDSMSKAFGFCGFRAGLVVSSKSNIESFHMIRQGVTSNSLSCELIPKVLENEKELFDHLQRLKEGKAYLESKYECDPSVAPYSLLKLAKLPKEFDDKVYYLKGTSNARVACGTKDVWESIGV